MAQFPIDKIYLYTRHPERQGTSCRAGSPIQPSRLDPPPPYPLLREAVEICGQWIITKAWVGPQTHETLSNMTRLHVPECSSPIVWHPGNQLMLGKHRQLVWKNLPKVSTPASLVCEMSVLTTTPQGHYYYLLLFLFSHGAVQDYFEKYILNWPLTARWTELLSSDKKTGLVLTNITLF